MDRRLAVAALVATLTLVPVFAAGADDASAGYAAIKPSLVKVWSMDASGKPIESGSGFIVASDANSSTIVTSNHVIAGAARIAVDLSRDVHDLPATVLAREASWDIALLRLDRGAFKVAKFAPTERRLVEGVTLAAAGYFKRDDQIGFTGQEPHLLYPGTISSLARNDRLIELANVEFEQGLSGGPVFDPATGAVVAMVETSHADQRGGYAVASAVLVSLLRGEHVTTTSITAVPATPRATTQSLVFAPPAAPRPAGDVEHRITPQPTIRSAPNEPQIVYRAPSASGGVSCANHVLTRVANNGQIVDASDGQAYGIADQGLMQIEVRSWSTGDRVAICRAGSSASIENPAHFAKVQATVVGVASSTSLSCANQVLTRVGDNGATVDASDGRSYRISDQGLMRIEVRSWSTGDRVSICRSGASASIDNPAHFAKVQATYAGTIETRQVQCRDQVIVRVGENGARVATGDGQSYAIADQGLMQIEVRSWSTGDRVTVCRSGASASIENPAHFSKVQATAQ